MNSDICGFDKETELLKLHDEGKLINKQGVCPRCGEFIDNYESIQFEGDMAYFPWHCDKCGLDGQEWYNLSFSGHNIYNEVGEELILED